MSRIQNKFRVNDHFAKCHIIYICDQTKYVILMVYITYRLHSSRSTGPNKSRRTRSNDGVALIAWCILTSGNFILWNSVKRTGLKTDTLILRMTETVYWTKIYWPFNRNLVLFFYWQISLLLSSSSTSAGPRIN